MARAGRRGKLTMAFVERVFSGVQPTGNLHLGNYLGAIVNFVKLQETHNCLYCVVDMHALTQPGSVWGGPAELAWIFNGGAGVGGLNRMTQCKEKAGKDRENASVGLYDYPVLMAAYILLYRATHVSVGEGQKQVL